MKTINAKDTHSAVVAPSMSSTNSSPIKIVSGKSIVHKPINKHRANPGFGKK